MRPPFFSLLLGFALPLAAPALPAAPLAVDEELIPLPTGAVVTKGMSRAAVADAMGDPAHVLRDKVWVYWDVRAKHRPPGEQFDALVVVFTDGRVTLLRLTSRDLVIEALERVKRESARRRAAPVAAARPAGAERT